MMGKKKRGMTALFYVENYSKKKFFYSVNVKLTGGALLRRPG